MMEVSERPLGQERVKADRIEVGGWVTCHNQGLSEGKAPALGEWNYVLPLYTIFICPGILLTTCDPY